MFLMRKTPRKNPNNIVPSNFAAWDSLAQSYLQSISTRICNQICIMDSSSSSSSDPDGVIYRRMFLETDACRDNAGMVVDHASRSQGGPGQGRLNRKKSRKFNENGLMPIQQRRRNHGETPRWIRFFLQPMMPGSLALDAFRGKLRVTFLMF